MLALDDGRYDFEKIYQGQSTRYVDRFDGTENEDRYLYRLDKVRGTMVFPGSKYVLGISCLAVNDPYENNDTIDTATWLDADIDAIMPCCRYLHGDMFVYDPDWYYVPIMPHRKASILYLKRLDMGEIQLPSIQMKRQTSCI